MLYIGIDLGTSAVKLLLMDSNGEIKNIVSKEYKLHIPKPGYSEQNPQDWWDKVCEGINDLLDGFDRQLVAGISFGGQMHGLVMLDEYDNVIRPAILWNDGRTINETKYLNEEIGMDVLINNTGNIAFAGFTAPKILWVKENEPDNFSKIAKIMLPKDYISYKLTGVHSCDYSDASGMLLLDVEHKCWSKKMLDICGIDESVLPNLYESYEITGNIKKDIAIKLGLSEKCIVCAGAGDNAAAAIGTGIIEDGMCNISLGTSGTVFIASDTYKADKSKALHSFAHANGKYHLMGCMLSAASCNKWWMDEIIRTTDYNKEQETIKELGDNNIYFLPYLMGERSPHNDPNARAAFIGMSLDTTREDMTQAVLEGVAFAFRDMIEKARELGVTITKSRICGGGAKSRLWQEIIANVLNIEVEVVANDEGPALGGAILAAVACGEYKNVEEAIKYTIKIKEIIKPNKEIFLKYNKKYTKFKQLYPALKDIYNS